MTDADGTTAFANFVTNLTICHVLLLGSYGDLHNADGDNETISNLQSLGVTFDGNPPSSLEGWNVALATAIGVASAKVERSSSNDTAINHGLILGRPFISQNK